MKHSLRTLCLRATSTIILLAAPFSPLWPAFASSAEILPGNDSLITMSVQNMPLGEVLEKIEAATDLRFNIDEQWQDIPVSVTLDKIPLDKALKRILVNLNNVVIYGSNEQVKIVVFGKAEPSGASGRPAMPPSYEKPPPEPLPPPLPDENPSVSPESEPESSPETEESAEATPADQERQTQEAAAEGEGEGEGEGETKTNDAESGAQNEPKAEGGAPQEGQPAEQQNE